MGTPGERSKNFLPSARRLVGRLRPQRARVLTAISLTVVSVGMSALGPLILARATDHIFAGWIGSKLPAGVPLESVVEQLRASGEGRRADMIEAMPYLVPGQGMDLGAIGRILLLALALYVVAAVLSWLQGRVIVHAVNQVVFDLRAQVEAKLHRLPLPYFDQQPRGELLSRVTNDIDNVAQSLQQTLSQLLTSLITVVAMVSMMVWVSPLLSLIALVTIPISIVLTGVIGKRSQRHFIQQWKSTGELSAVVEETYTGHSLVKVFGRQAEVDAAFAERNEELRGA
ncbi:MAG TPA: multidrug ABC transporter ATP-binding protein, partial [Janibacter terrae]|nr:multidrug ABC transporter ATP-binding protein [Janibacter terrae]